MSAQVMSWVLQHAPADVRPAEMLALVVLAEHANAESGLAYPSVGRIAQMGRLSERAVVDALKSLVARGVLVVEMVATNKRPTVYAFPAFRGAPFAPQEASRGANPSKLGVQIPPARGANPAPKLDVRERNDENDRPPKPPTGGYPPAFEDFWKRYPPTNGSKAAAYKCWERLKPAQRQTASANLDKWIASTHWQNGYVRHAATWLGPQKLWEQEPVDKGPPAKSANGHLSDAELADIKARSRALQEMT